MIACALTLKPCCHQHTVRRRQSIAWSVSVGHYATMTIAFLGERFSFNLPLDIGTVHARLQRGRSDIDANRADYGGFICAGRMTLYEWAGRDIVFLRAKLEEHGSRCTIKGRHSLSLSHALPLLALPVVLTRLIGSIATDSDLANVWPRAAAALGLVAWFPMMTLLNRSKGLDMLRTLRAWAETDVECGAEPWSGMPVTRRVTVDQEGEPDRVIADAAALFRILSFLHPDGDAVILRHAVDDNLQINRTGDEFHIDRRQPMRQRPERAVALDDRGRNLFTLAEAMDVVMDYLTGAPADARVLWRPLG